MTFIEKFINHLRDSDHSLRELTVIVPSERMKKVIMSELPRIYGAPVFAPRIYTMDKWIHQLSGFHIPERTRLLLKLYEVYRAYAPDDMDKSFEEFLIWGEILLSDFQEFDRYLVDQDKLFTNLCAIKDIENWSFNSTELSPAQEKFLAFWELLPILYAQFVEVLKLEGASFSGHAFRKVADGILNTISETEGHIFFVGFNALSKSESHIIKSLVEAKRASFIVDADRYYLDEDGHEAGYFIRLNAQISSLNSMKFVSDELNNKAMKVELISCAQVTGQVKVAATLLDGMSKPEMENTLLLLADESLVPVLLKNLPSSVGKANLTLGMSLKSTSLRTWVELLFQFHESKLRFKTNSLYHTDVQRLITHPFVQAAINVVDRNELNKLEQDILSGNQVFVSAVKLRSIKGIEFLLDPFLQSMDLDRQEWMKMLRRVNAALFDRLVDHEFERTLIARFDQSLMDFENLLLEGLPEMNSKSFKYLFNQHWQKVTLAYHGNPTRGLQVMGLLETRGLDFKKIIVIGMNEGNLPPSNTIQTLIPMDLRKVFGMPMVRDKQALFAHHFYRLLHQCEELYVTYSSADPVMGMAEPSRYLIQLEKELARQNPLVKIHKSVYAPDVVQDLEVQSFEKTADVLGKMSELLAQSTSASMLNTYIKCPLNFYFKYVLEFGEEKEVEEQIEQNTFGTIVHEVLELLYRPFARLDKDDQEQKNHRALRTEDLDEMLKRYPAIQKECFDKHFKGNSLLYEVGRNYLAYEMADELIKRFLETERSRLKQLKGELYIESLEKRLSVELKIKVGETEKIVRLSGVIDRIDRIGEHYRIIDYKSGVVKEDDTTFISRGDHPVESSIRTRKHVLQLLMYAYMFKQTSGITASPGIISFIKGQFDVFQLNTRDFSLEDVVEDFPDYLRPILEELFDVELPFLHTTDPISYCLYCE